MYEKIISKFPLTLAEKKIPYQDISERHVQALWLEQKYFQNLKTSGGEPIEVISPGLWNVEAGPDFLKAHLRIGEKEYRGDIEIHLNVASWQQHQHHHDPKYDRVILHLIFWQAQKPVDTPVANSKGQFLKQAYLENFLTVPPIRLVNLIDLDLYPYKQFVGSGRCAKELFKTLPEYNIREFFKSAAQHRLLQKETYLNFQFEDSNQQLLAGVAMALGYKNNAENFLSIFKRLIKKEPNERILILDALSMAGFFSKEYQKKWEASSHYNDLLCKHKTEQELVPLLCHQVRPLNHPLRRLIYLCKLLSDPANATLFQKFLDHWNEVFSVENCKHKKTLNSFLDLIPTYEDPYWNYHYTFETKRSPTRLPLIGINLKTEIFVNVVLPMIYVQVQNNGSLNEQKNFMQFYASIQSSLTGKSKYLSHRFFGQSMKKDILKSTMMQQGAYQLHRDFCVHFEASCEGCPFVERYIGSNPLV